jgi:hypothetical protein
MTDWSPLFDKARFASDASYKAGILDGLNHAIAIETRTQQELDARARANWKAVLRARCRGWNSPDWCCYFWFVGWDCISFGLHVCVGGPNIEIHLPFGFLRIGRHTNVTARRQIAEESVDA